ncbi:MAG: hypothetical protein ACREHV_11400 [Rhizomicrobium sp.]
MPMQAFGRLLYQENTGGVSKIEEHSATVEKIPQQSPPLAANHFYARTGAEQAAPLLFSPNRGTNRCRLFHMKHSTVLPLFHAWSRGLTSSEPIPPPLISAVC